MKLYELKQILNDFPIECDDMSVIFGECVPGEELENVKVFGNNIELNYF